MGYFADIISQWSPDYLDTIRQSIPRRADGTIDWNSDLPMTRDQSRYLMAVRNCEVEDTIPKECMVQQKESSLGSAIGYILLSIVITVILYVIISEGVKLWIK